MAGNPSTETGTETPSAELGDVARTWVRDCTELVRELGACVHEPAVLVQGIVGHRVDVCVLCGARRLGNSDEWIDAEYTRRARAMLERIR